MNKFEYIFTALCTISLESVAKNEYLTSKLFNTMWSSLSGRITEQLFFSAEFPVDESTHFRRFHTQVYFATSELNYYTEHC